MAMGILYDRYGSTAYALILRILGEPAEAEDVLAETFVKAWNQIGSFRDSQGEELGFWILSLARNQSIEHLRTSGDPLKSSALEHPLLFRSMPQSIGRGRNTEQIRALQNALAGLDSGERQILELAYFNGLSAQEIGQKLAQPPAKVRKSISAALEKISSVITNA